mmetsp:Transcript_29773/g.97013  ORF Transcript_29773/g.97013 Transcript_29773/m.97013 type:complete len:315 (-) Transcript_29773:26-970(-)
MREQSIGEVEPRLSTKAALTLVSCPFPLSSAPIARSRSPAPLPRPRAPPVFAALVLRRPRASPALPCSHRQTFALTRGDDARLRFRRPALAPDRLERVEHGHSAGDAPKYDVLVIEMPRGAEEDEELTVVRVRARIRHRKQPSLCVPVRKGFVLEITAVYALPACAVPACNIPSLRHEPIDDSVEKASDEVESDAGAPAAALSRAERPKVLSRLGHVARKELDREATDAFAADGDVEVDEARAGLRKDGARVAPALLAREVGLGRRSGRRRSGLLRREDVIGRGLPLFLNFFSPFALRLQPFLSLVGKLGTEHV